MLVLNNNIKTIKQTNIKDMIKNPLLFNQYSYDLKYGEDDSLSAYVLIPSKMKTFEEYFNLLDYKSGKKS